MQGAALISDAIFSTPKKNKAQKWISTDDLLRQRSAGAALISDTGFSTPKKNRAQKWILTDDLLRQRSAGRGNGFCRWIFYAKEEQGAEMDFNR